MPIPHMLRRGASTTDVLRTLWGLGISTVLTVAVIPYPAMALYSTSEDSHRLHDTVGALQYLPLWALPVMLFTLGIDREGAWRLALATSLVIAGVGVWAGDLLPSASWMPLATLVVLWPRDVRWAVQRWSAVGATGAALALLVAVKVAPDLVHLQQMKSPEPHSVRFHFSGTAAAYLSLTMAALVVTLWRTSTVVHVTVAVSLALGGVANLLWPDQVSAIETPLAWALVGAGTLVGCDAMRCRHIGATGRRRRQTPIASL